MRPAMLAFGMLIVLLVVPSYFLGQLSGGTGAIMPITWEYFILPGIVTAIGLTLIVIGMKLKSGLSAGDVREHSINHFH